jgi:hypothetical protein
MTLREKLELAGQTGTDLNLTRFEAARLLRAIDRARRVAKGSVDPAHAMMCLREALVALDEESKP